MIATPGIEDIENLCARDSQKRQLILKFAETEV